MDATKLNALLWLPLAELAAALVLKKQCTEKSVRQKHITLLARPCSSLKRSDLIGSGFDLHGGLPDPTKVYIVRTRMK